MVYQRAMVGDILYTDNKNQIFLVLETLMNLLIQVKIHFMRVHFFKKCII
jgi:hypothetical protein